MHAHEICPAGTWDRTQARDSVLIDYDRRHRRRILLTTQSGAEILLDVPQAVRLRHGDALRLEDGSLIRVDARPEALLDIHAHDDGELVRIAWHLGNRHLPVQLLDDHIRIRADHVIEAMVEQLGGHVEHILAPFDPEDGAYSGGGHHHHHHDDDDHHHHGTGG
jgi:urease accessory protein